MSGLKTTIMDDMKAAMRAKDKDRLATIRLIQAAIKQIEVDERIDVDDERVMTILVKQAKQRKESISQYEKAERADLIKQEQFELNIINEYLPQPLSEDEVASEVEQAITQSGATSIKDMGKVMGLLNAKLKGRADMGKVSTMIKAKLNA